MAKTVDVELSRACQYLISRIVLCLSIFLILAVCVERYTAVCRPHHYREGQASSSRLLCYLLPALLAALLVNLTKFLEVRVLHSHWSGPNEARLSLVECC